MTEPTSKPSVLELYDNLATSLSHATKYCNVLDDLLREESPNHGDDPKDDPASPIQLALATVNALKTELECFRVGVNGLYEARKSPDRGAGDEALQALLKRVEGDDDG